MRDRRSYKAKDIYLSKKSANVALVKVRASHLDLFLSRALSVDIRKIESFDDKRAVYHSVVHSNLEQPETVLIRTKRITTGVSLESLYEAMPVKDSEVDINVNVFSEYDAFSLVKFTSYDGQINTDLNVETKFVNVIVEFETSADLDTFIESKVYSLEDIGLTVNVVSDYDAETVVKFVELNTSVDIDIDVEFVESTLEDINVTTIASSDYDADTIVKFTEFDTFVNTDVDVDTMLFVVEDINTTITSSSNYDGFVILQEEVNTTVDVSSEYEAIVPILYENDFEQYSDFDNLTNEDWTMLLSETGDLLQARNRAATDFGDVSLFFYNEFFTPGTSIWKWDEVSLPSQTDGQLLIRQTPDNSNDEIIHLMKSGESNGSFYGLGFARDCDNNVAKIVHFDGDYDSYNTLVDTSLEGIIETQETVWWRFIIEEQTDGSFDLTLRLATLLDGSNENTLLTTNYDGNLASPTASFSEAWNVVYGTQTLWLDYYAATPTAGYNIPYPEPF